MAPTAAKAGELRDAGPTSYCTWEAAMSQSDQDFLLARVEQERELASRSTDEIVRAIHLKMAHEYAMRAHGNDLLSRDDSDVLVGAVSGLTLL